MENTLQTFDIELLDSEQKELEKIRLNFIRKITFTLLCNFIGILQIPCIQQITDQSFFVWIFLILLILVFFLLISFQKIAKQNPFNYISYIVFTISISYIFIHFSQNHQNYSLYILSINLLQFTVILSLIHYTFYTNNDITLQKGILYIIVYILIILIIIIFYSELSIIYLFILSLIMILYGIHIIIDTILIVNGEKHELDADDYIIAALMTQVDILTLFQVFIQKFKLCNDKSN